MARGSTAARKGTATGLPICARGWRPSQAGSSLPAPDRVFVSTSQSHSSRASCSETACIRAGHARGGQFLRIQLPLSGAEGDRTSFAADAPDCRPRWRHDHHCTNNQIGPVRGGRSEFEVRRVDIPGPGIARYFFDNLTLLYEALRRFYQLAVSLPAVPLRRFEEKVRDLPRSTDAERLVVQRIGQDIFRESLLEYWQGRCPLTGMTD